MIQKTIASKSTALLWLLVVSISALFALLKGPAFDTSIMALLPASQQNPLVSKATDKVADQFSEQAVLLLSASDRALAREAVHRVVTRLSQLEESVELTWKGGDQAGWAHELEPYRFVLLPDAVRKRLLAGQDKHQQQLALQRIFSPLSGVKADPIKDPFMLHAEQIFSATTGMSVTQEQGLIRLTEAQVPTYLITLHLKEDPFSLSLQQKLLSVLEPLEDELRIAGVRIIRSGLLWHAAAGAEQAESEISVIGIGSLMGILLLMLVVFKRAKPLWMVLLPVLVGCVMALSVTLLLFGRVHLITIAFGAGLVGVSVDYALHYLCEHRRRPGIHLINVLLAGLLLSLMSSVIAYAGLALTPFPGLRQMAIFSVVGLIASWLTVVLWLPFLSIGEKANPLPAAAFLQRWRNIYPSVHDRPQVAVMLLAVLIGSVVIVWKAEPVDDVRLLQTSPESLLVQDRIVQDLTGNTTSAQFLMVVGDSLNQVLQLEEALQPELNRMVAASSFAGYQSLSQVLPSLQRQAENAKLIRQLYQKQMAEQARIMRLSESQQAAAWAEMEQASEQRLLPEEWKQLKSGQVWQHLIIDNEEGGVASVVRLQGRIEGALKVQLSDLADRYEHVFFIDRVDSISEVLRDYREQIFSWLLVAYSIVIFVLIGRYRANFWRVLVPPVIASSLAFATVIVLNDGYNLFNLIALILVLGIGLDMGIFMQESPHSDHTWLAVTLSVLTSLLAFGLLALSKTPVLYHFGIIILPGLLLVWLLSPLMKCKTN